MKPCQNAASTLLLLACTGSVAFALLATPVPAQACVVVGMDKGTPLCGGGSPGVYIGPTRASVFFHGLRARIELAMARREEARQQGLLEQEIQQQLEQMPEYQQFMRGHWTVEGPVMSENDTAPSCFATFARQDKVLYLRGNAVAGQQAILTLVDLDPQSPIGKPQELERIRVTLEQSGARPATVDVFNHKFDDYPAITFAVPTLDMAIDALVDSQSMVVKAGRRTLYSLEYRDGLLAKQQMQQCRSLLQG